MSLDSLKQQIEKKLRNPRIFTLCDKCNKEFRITNYECGIAVFCRCPHCNHNNQRWLKVEILKDVLKLVGDLEKTLQEQIKHMIREAENDEIADVRAGCYSLAEQFGLKVKQDEYGEYYLDELGDEK